MPIMDARPRSCWVLANGCGGAGADQKADRQIADNGAQEFREGPLAHVRSMAYVLRNIWPKSSRHTGQFTTGITHRLARRMIANAKRKRAGWPRRCWHQNPRQPAIGRSTIAGGAVQTRRCCGKPRAAAEKAHPGCRYRPHSHLDKVRHDDRPGRCDLWSIPAKSRPFWVRRDFPTRYAKARSQGSRYACCPCELRHSGAVTFMSYRSTTRWVDHSADRRLSDDQDKARSGRVTACRLRVRGSFRPTIRRRAVCKPYENGAAPLAGTSGGRGSALRSFGRIGGLPVGKIAHEINPRLLWLAENWRPKQREDPPWYR